MSRKCGMDPGKFPIVLNGLDHIVRLCDIPNLTIYEYTDRDDIVTNVTVFARNNVGGEKGYPAVVNEKYFDERGVDEDGAQDFYALNRDRKKWLSAEERGTLCGECCDRLRDPAKAPPLVVMQNYSCAGPQGSLRRTLLAAGVKLIGASFAMIGLEATKANGGTQTKTTDRYPHYLLFDDAPVGSLTYADSSDLTRMTMRVRCAGDTGSCDEGLLSEFVAKGQDELEAENAKRLTLLKLLEENARARVIYYLAKKDEEKLALARQHLTDATADLQAIANPPRYVLETTTDTPFLTKPLKELLGETNARHQELAAVSGDQNLLYNFEGRKKEYEDDMERWHQGDAPGHLVLVPVPAGDDVQGTSSEGCDDEEGPGETAAIESGLVNADTVIEILAAAVASKELPLAAEEPVRDPAGSEFHAALKAVVGALAPRRLTSLTSRLYSVVAGISGWSANHEELLEKLPKIISAGLAPLPADAPPADLEDDGGGE